LPELINLRFAHWFGSGGDTDSIGAASLAALENPTHMASSRLFIVTQILGPWRRDYEAVFGNLPSELIGSDALPSAGLPAPPLLQWEVNVAAAGLASMGDSHLLDNIISKAIGEHLAPALELSRRAFDQAPPPPGWVAAYEKMSPSQVAAVNQVYANVGVAIGSYLRGLVAFDSAFDRFADRWRENIAAAAALGDGFTNRELIGLKLFVGPGQCINCHSGPTLTDQQFHNIGLSQLGETIMGGRAVGSVRVLTNPFNCIGPFGQKLRREASDCAHITTLNTEDIRNLGAFKTPSLRNLAHRQRFMHDQRFTTLETTLAYYNELTDRVAIGQRDPALRPLGFTSEELEALEAFLNSLSSPVRDLNEKSRH
jgi:cytochrome c peroxidase